MKKAISLAIIGILCSTASAFAKSDLISKIESPDPGATPFQILQKLYNEATAPASLSDFDLVSDTSSNQHCAGAEKDYASVYPLYVARAAIVVAPGTPAVPTEGPLFPGTPGTPDQLGYVISYSSDSNSRSDLQELADQDAKNTTVESTPTDLVQTISESGDVSAFYARKNGSFIAIHWIWNPGAKDEIDGYAYCYRQ